MNTVVENLQQLITFKTVAGNDDEFKACWDFIDAQMREIPGWGFRAYESNGNQSRVYSHQSYIASDIKDFDVYLYANIDVVDGSDVVFESRIEGDKLIGRGAIDMKLGVAVAIGVLQQLSEAELQQKIAFVITSDEELGGIDGARYLIEDQGYTGDCVIGPNGEYSPTKWKLELQNKGTIHIQFTTEGKPAHGSRPWQGKNALDTLISAYQEIYQGFHKGSETVWDSTVNIGMLNGGFATNAVADYATMNIDFRYTNLEQAEAYYDFVQKVEQKYGITSRLIVDAVCIDVKPDDPHITSYMDIVKQQVAAEDIENNRCYGSHDLREFFKAGITPIIFMPRGAGNHTEEEWVSISDLEKLVKINIEFVQQRTE